MISDRATHLSDLTYLLKKYKGRIFLCALLFSLAALSFFAASAPPQYRAYCSFQESGKKLAMEGGLSSALRLMSGSYDEKGALVAMQSETLMGKAIQKSGLQIWPQKGRDYYLSNARAQLQKSYDFLDFEDVQGDVQVPLNFTLIFTGARTFDLFDPEGALLGSGTLGSPAQLGGVKFTVAKAGVKKSYPLTLLPLNSATQKVRHKFKINPNRQNPALLKLSFSHERRQAALTFLGELMEGYRRQLLEDHHLLIQRQLAYLKKRQGQVREEYEMALAQHATYLQDHLGQSGFLHLSQELSTLEKPRLELSTQQRGLAIDLEHWAALKPYDERLSESMVEEVAISEKWRSLEASNSEQPLPSTHRFDGADLISVQRLQEQLVQERSMQRAEIEKLLSLKKRTLDPGFDVSALTDFFVDPVGLSLAQKGSDIQLKLLDPSNYSQKELNRLEVTLQKQRELILDHVDKRVSFLEEQWASGGRVLATLKARALELVKNEQNLATDQIKEIGASMDHLPQKWRLENQIKLRRDLALQMMEGIIQLTESKIIDHQFFSVESRAVDPPYAPPFPAMIDLKFISIISALCGGALSLGVLLFSVPLPVNARYFQERSKRFAIREDPDFFKNLAYSVPTDRAVTLFAEGKSRGDCQEVALLLARRGIKVLLIEIGHEDEPQAVEEGPFWKAKLKDTEALNGPAIFAQLEEWKKNFDAILISTTWSSKECLHLPLKDQCQALVTYIEEESAQPLETLLKDPRAFFVLPS